MSTLSISEARLIEIINLVIDKRSVIDNSTNSTLGAAGNGNLAPTDLVDRNTGGYVRGQGDHSTYDYGDHYSRTGNRFGSHVRQPVDRSNDRFRQDTTFQQYRGQTDRYAEHRRDNRHNSPARRPGRQFDDRINDRSRQDPTFQGYWGPSYRDAEHRRDDRGSSPAWHTVGPRGRVTDTRRENGAQQQMINPPASHSTNPDYTRLIRFINLYVRSTHAMGNWSNSVPPPSVRRQMADLFDCINPPGSNDEFRTALRDLHERTQADLSNLVESFLRNKLDTLKNDIQGMSQRDRVGAEDIVQYQLRNLRIRPNKLEEALAATRVPVSSATNQPPPRNDVTNATTSVSNRFHVLRHPDHELMDQTTPTTPSRSSKRPASLTCSPAPPAARGRHTSSPDAQNHAQRLLRKSPESAATVAPVTSHTDADASEATTSDVTGGRMIVTNKDADHQWNFDTISPPESVSTLVIADSNGRQWRSIPADWQVLTFPGAHIQDVDRLLCGINLPSSLTAIVLAVGVNNRREPSAAIEDHITELHAMTSELDVPTFFLGVPALDRATPAEDRGASSINDVAARLFASNYIPLPADFQIQYTSASETNHYTHATASRYIGAVKTFLASKN